MKNINPGLEGGIVIYFILEAKISILIKYLLVQYSQRMGVSVRKSKRYWQDKKCDTLSRYLSCLPIPVAERSKAHVYGRSLAGIAGSNPAGGMDGCPL